MKTIESFEDLVYRIPEAILEGISKKPEDFLILGMGFFVGYNGVDLMRTLFGSFMGLPAGPPSTWNIEKMQIVVDKITAATKDNPLLNIFGQAFASKLQTIEDIKNDYGAQSLETKIAVVNTKIIFGCIGGLTAYSLTRPGSIGEIVKGIGEIIPF